MQGDLLDTKALTEALQGSDFVFHLAANADVRFGTDDPRKDLEQNTIATFNLLEAMRAAGSNGLPSLPPAPSTGRRPCSHAGRRAVSGQTSLYGASKLAGEALIQAYCEGFRFNGFISVSSRFWVNDIAMGMCWTFAKGTLLIRIALGCWATADSGNRTCYVDDCIDAMLLALDKATRCLNIFNLGTDEYIAVNDSISWISRYLGVSPHWIYSGGDRAGSATIRLSFWTALACAPSAGARRLDSRGRRSCGRWIGSTANRWVFECTHMKVGVLGLWHLGSVTAACTAAAGVPSIGVDDDAVLVADLAREANRRLRDRSWLN